MSVIVLADRFGCVAAVDAIVARYAAAAAAEHGLVVYRVAHA